MRTLPLVPVMLLISLQAFAQAPDSSSATAADPAVDASARARRAAMAESSLATPTGHDLSFNISSYTYSEPGDTAISIHGPKYGGEYTGTLSLNRRAHWFARVGVRGTAGSATYDGWCFPYLIRPDSGSPNGWALDLGDPSPCSESGDRDWYMEGSGVLGKDLIGDNWAFSPYAGLGLRHLSNGTTGIPGYRTDNYLYLPLGMTARTRVASHGTLGINLEYDQLLHGWQTTRDSRLGSGDVPATPTAPAFTINGFTDISFAQSGGWALRASAKYQVNRRWSIEPSYIYWHVSASPTNYETVTFTVNNITAAEQWGAYEPKNTTREFDLKFGLHF